LHFSFEFIDTARRCVRLGRFDPKHPGSGPLLRALTSHTNGSVTASNLFDIEYHLRSVSYVGRVNVVAIMPRKSYRRTAGDRFYHSARWICFDDAAIHTH
jgi:hypothetical protein